MNEGFTLASCSTHDTESWKELIGSRRFLLHTCFIWRSEKPSSGKMGGVVMSWPTAKVNRKGQREGWNCQWIGCICIKHVWEDGAAMSHSITAVRNIEGLHQRMMWRPRPQPQGAESTHPAAGQEEKEKPKKQKERKKEYKCAGVCVCVGGGMHVCVRECMCVCITQFMLGLTPVIWPGLRGHRGGCHMCTWVCQHPGAWTVKQVWKTDCDEASWQQLLWNQQRWHVLPGAERKTSHVGCERSPHQKSVMYAKLCRYEGRTNGWGWCNCLKQGISLSLMSRASVMGLFTLLSWQESAGVIRNTNPLINF